MPNIQHFLKSPIEKIYKKPKPKISRYYPFNGRTLEYNCSQESGSELGSGYGWKYQGRSWSGWKPGINGFSLETWLSRTHQFLVSSRVLTPPIGFSGKMFESFTFQLYLFCTGETTSYIYILTGNALLHLYICTYNVPYLLLSFPRKRICS
jgi:hypothetical protein